MIFPGTSGLGSAPGDASTWIGQTLVAENYNNGGGGGVATYTATTYTPWVIAGGEAGVFVTDLVGISPVHQGGDSTPRLRMFVETKDFNQADSAASTVGTSSDHTSAGTVPGLQTPVAVTGLKQLARLRFVLDDSDASPVARVFWACFRALPPQWRTH